MATKKIIEVEVKSNAKDATKDINSATTATTNLGNATQEAGKKASTFSDIKNVVTGMVPGLKAADGGVKTFSASLKALAANPIILIITVLVGALKFIYEAFQSNVKIGKEIAAVWEGLSGVGSQIVDSVMGMVRAFGYAAVAAYKFITLDFKGASKAMKQANAEATTSFDQLTNAVNGTTFAILRGLEKQQQANNKAKKEQAVRESEINKLLVQSREILTDETASIKEKKKALEEVTKAEKASAAEKVRTAAVDLKILQEKAKALGGQAEKKMKQEIRDATIALNEAETENAMTGIKLNKQRKMLARQEKEDNKAAVDAAKDRIKAAKEAREAELKAKNESIEKIRKAEQEYADTLLTEQEREKVNVQRKYEELYKDAKKYNLDVTKLKENETAELLKIDTKYQEQKQKIIDDANKKANALRIQAENDFQAQIEAIDEANFQASLKNKMTAEQYELEQVRQKYFALEEAAKGNAEQLAIIEEAKNNEIDQINQTYADKEKQRKKANQDFAIEMAQSGLSTIQGLTELFGKKNEKAARKAFQINKAAQIASATIDTYKSATSAYASQIIPGDPSSPVRAAIAAGVAIAAGLVNVAKIASQKFEGGGSSGGGSAPSGGAMQAPNFNVIGSSGVNQLAQIQQQPTRAYVVSGDVANGLSLERNRLQNATL